MSCACTVPHSTATIAAANHLFAMDPSSFEPSMDANAQSSRPKRGRGCVRLLFDVDESRRCRRAAIGAR